MKNNRNDLNDMLSLVRDYPPAEPILSREDVQRTLEGAEAWQPTISPVRRRIRIMSVVAGVVAAGTATILWLSDGSTAPYPPAVAAQHQSPTPQQSAQPEPAEKQTMQMAVSDRTEQPRHTAETTTPVVAPKLSVSGTPAQSSGGTNRGGTAAHTEREPIDIPGIMRIVHITYDSADMARNRARETSADTALNINGIGALELTPQELEQLGIEVTSTGLRLFAEEKYSATDPRITRQLHRLGYDTTQPDFIKRYNIEIDTFTVGLSTVTNPIQNRYSRIVPIAIYNQYIKTEDTAGSHLSYFQRSPLLTELITQHHASPDSMKKEVFHVNSPQTIDEAQQGALRKSPLASKLIPIYLRMGDQLIPGTKRRRGADIYLWYYPTREFIAALPERYRSALQDELEVLANVEGEGMKSSDACGCLPGGPTFLDVCRKSSGAVTSASLFPNPAQKSTTVQYKITQPRYVTITLHDLAGRYLRTLESGKELIAGDYHTALNLHEVQSGTYLVVVRTDRSEQAVQRLIVQ